MSRRKKFEPSSYKATAALKRAVDMAVELQMPLLLTGEPGVGKSVVASWQAYQSAVPLFRTTVHSDTRYRDLFYSFDDIGRFFAANRSDSNRTADARNYLRFTGLGAAILCANYSKEAWPEWLQPILERQRSDFEIDSQTPKPVATQFPAVVLIDEIDKAPRDVPNDLLTQLDQWRFRVPELEGTEGYAIEAGFELDGEKNAPLVVITSNNEQELPGAFMRRCVYHHIALPLEPAEYGDPTLEEIITSQVTENLDENLQLDITIKAFQRTRELLVQNQYGTRKPGLAELIDVVNWMSTHSKQPADERANSRKEAFASLLLKNKDVNLVDFLQDDEISAWINSDQA